MLRFIPIFLIMLMTNACKTSSANGTTFEGTLIKKPWTKSTQSYCAQGSDYYVLKTKSEEYVLEASSLSPELLEKNVNAIVAINGMLEKRTITPPKDNISQHPVSISENGDDTFECTVLVVKKLEETK